MKMFARVLATTVLLGLVGVQGHAQSPETKQQIAAALKVSSGHFNVFEVPSSGTIADAAFIEKSKASGPSKIAKQLAKGLAAAESGALEVAIVGPSEAKNAQVIRDALAATGKKSLPGLTLIFVGGKATADELGPVLAGYGAKFVHALQ